MHDNEPHDTAVREHLLYLMRGGGAHLSFEDLVADFPAEKCGQKLEGLPYTPWQVLEHMRIAQWDILEFSRDKNHTSPDFPVGYWPKKDDPGTPEQWDESVEKFRADMKAFEQLVADPDSELFANIPHGEGQTILREALLAADHNAYHLGVLTVMRRMLDKSA
jgi:hypothetical protein